MKKTVIVKTPTEITICDWCGKEYDSDESRPSHEFIDGKKDLDLHYACKKEALLSAISSKKK